MNNPHVLIVDDDDKLRRLLNQYLTRSGFTITEACSPIEAQEILKLFSFDAIVMDVMMPFQNGVAYTKELRQKGLTTPILILTAMGDTNNRISGLEAGADDVVTEDEVFTIITTPSNFNAVKDYFEAKGITFLSADVELVPQSYVDLDDDQYAVFTKMIDEFEENDDVQDVYHNVNLK